LVTETKSAAELSAFAHAHEVPEVRLEPKDREAFERDLMQALLDADVGLVSLTFDRIVPPAIVAAFQGRIINVHPALLPGFPGTRAIDRLLESGVRFGGATIHEVTDEVDGGPTVAQAVVPTIPGESVASYGARMYAALEPMYLDVLRWYADGLIEHDDHGRVVVKGADYGSLPVSPTMAR
jgi:phosphoribosylglycinamide formyltransferase-1